MKKRKLWWGKKQPYEILQWIQGDGRTQWVEFPGIYPSEDWAIEIVATPKEFGTQGYCHAYGAGSASSAADAVICVLNGTGGTLARFVGTIHSGIEVQLDTQYTIYQDANICTANGEKTPTNSGTASGTALSYPLRLFRNPTATTGNLPKLCGVIQFSSVRAWKKTTGQLMLDVVPVLDKDGVACFWDRVGDKLYYNQGTGSFTYKRWLNTECDYLYADGNAYSDPYCYGDSDAKMEVVMAITTQASGNTGTMGSRITANSQLLAVGYGGSVLASDFNNSRYQTYRASCTYELNKKYRCYTSKEKRSIIDENSGVVLGENTTLCSDTMDTGALLIGAETGITDKHIGNFYSGKYWDGAVSKRDLIPAIDENNVAGFYDKCLNIMFYSIGTSPYEAHFIDDNNNDYKVVQYITAQQVATSTNTNACPYIKTGVIPGASKKTRMKFKASFGTVDSSYEKFIGGENIGGRFVVGMAGSGSSANKVYFGLGATNYWTTIVADTNKHVYELDWATKTCAVDGTSFTISTDDYDSTGDFWINARHTSNNANANRPGGGDTVYLKFWNYRKLAYNGIPVIRVSDNTAGLFETIKREFQTSAGTIDYTYTA